MQTADLVHLNAILNGIAFVLILLGLRAIRRAAVDATHQPALVATHKKFMLAAAGVSAAFLVSYLVYHFTNEPVKFAGEGGIRVVYLLILLTHIVLAVVQVPLILVTIAWGVKGQLDKHKRIARWTAGIWIYVSMTGVLVYLLLYHLY
jgi:putative membrane protein